MGIKVILILVVIAVLMEDSSSIKKTEEEEKEDEELAKAVNRTLAEEEKQKEEEERKKRDEKKKTTDKVTDNKEKKTDTEKQVGQGEDCPACNSTCPELEMCRPCGPCPEQKTCEKCPEPQSCPPCKRCPDPVECPEVEPCKPCGPCPPVHCKSCNDTSSSTPPCQCLEAGLTVPVAMMVGVITGLVAMGVATILGFLLRYTPPVVSGLLFLAIVLLTWFLSSRYPEVAREAGGRVVAVLREATVALGHRIMEAIRHHNDQVGLPGFLLILLSNLSSIFHLKSLH
jgi:hypothetical protein